MQLEESFLNGYVVALKDLKNHIDVSRDVIMKSELEHLLEIKIRTYQEELNIKKDIEKENQ